MARRPLWPLLFLYDVGRRSPGFGEYTGYGLWLPLWSRCEEEPLSFKFFGVSGCLGLKFKTFAAFCRALALSMVAFKSSPKSLVVDSVFFRTFCIFSSNLVTRNDCLAWLRLNTRSDCSFTAVANVCNALFRAGYSSLS